MKKLIVLLAVLGLAGGVYYWQSSKPKVEEKSESTKPTFVVVKKGPLKATVEATGRVVPQQEVDIKCKASGEIVELPVDVSDIVKQGQILLRLDPDDEEQNLKRAEVNRAVSEARLEQARLEFEAAGQDLSSERLKVAASLTSAKAKADDANSTLKRINELLGKKIASQEEYDAAQVALAQADASLKNAEASVAGLKAQEIMLTSRKFNIEIAEQEVIADDIALADARRRLAETTVRAPISGVVAARNVQVGQIIASGVSNVGGGTDVMTIADLERIFVLVAVDESDIGNVKTGQSATVTVDAYPDRNMRGMVKRIATKGVVTSNVVTFEVKVEVTSRQKDLLKPEMTANVSIVTVDREEALLLPVEAVTKRGPKTMVLLPGDGVEDVKQEVKVGESDGENIEIISGLKAGDRVMLPGNKGSGGWRKDGGDKRSEGRAERMKGRMQSRMISGGGH